MTEPIDVAGVAEAARLLDDQTQQLMPVPAWLNADGAETPDSTTESNK